MTPRGTVARTTWAKSPHVDLLPGTDILAALTAERRSRMEMRTLLAVIAALWGASVPPDGE